MITPFIALATSTNHGSQFWHRAAQIYPQDAHQAQALTASAMRAGFAGGLVVDFPHSTRAKKYFLVLMVGGNAGGGVPAARGLDGGEEGGDDEDGAIAVAGRHQRGKKRRKGMGGAGVRASLEFLVHACMSVGRPQTPCATLELVQKSFGIQEVPVNTPCAQSCRCSHARHGLRMVREMQSVKDFRCTLAVQFSARHPDAKGKAWILKKKEQARHKGYVGIPADTRYTGRKRKDRF